MLGCDAVERERECEAVGRNRGIKICRPSRVGNSTNLRFYEYFNFLTPDRNKGSLKYYKKFMISLTLFTKLKQAGQLVIYILTVHLYSFMRPNEHKFNFVQTY